MKNAFLHYVELIEKGALLEVIEKYFASDIIQIENTGASLQGREVLWNHEKKNLDSVKSVDIKIPNYAINEEKGITLGEMIIHFDLKQMGKKKIEEAFLQKWKDEKIYYQRFYFKEILADD